MRLQSTGGVLIAAALALQATGQAAAETGAEAFATRDFTAAAELWRKEAAAGSARAKFGLGLLSDLGLGVPRDAAKALRWYLEAADEGVSDAQFNVAVMLDAGTGVPRDVGAAAVWYGRAAANGHHRAQYNLGLLYEAGEAVPRNPISRATGWAAPRRPCPRPRSGWQGSPRPGTSGGALWRPAASSAPW